MELRLITEMTGLSLWEGILIILGSCLIMILRLFLLRYRKKEIFSNLSWRKMGLSLMIGNGGIIP